MKDLGEPAVPVQAIAAGHEHRVGNPVLGRIGKLGPPGNEAFGEAQEEVGRPVVGRDAVGVELVPGTVSQLDVLQLAPIQEIGRGGPADGPDRGEPALGGSNVTGWKPDSQISDVPVSEPVPEDPVPSPVRRRLREDRLLADRLPVDPVGRNHPDHPLQGAVGLPRGQCLVPFLGWSLGIGVQEDHEVVVAEAVPDDVVLLRPVELHQPQRRPGPGPAVPALDVAGHLGMFGDHGLARFQEGRDRGGRETVAPVVHAIEAVAVDHRDVEAGRALPRLVEVEHSAAGGGGLKLQPDVPGHGVDQVVVHHELQPVADVQSLGLVVTAGSQRRCCEQQSRE